MAIAEQRSTAAPLWRDWLGGRIEDLLYSRSAMGVLAYVLAGVLWELFGRSGLALSFPPLSKVLVAWVDLIGSGVLAKELPRTLQSFAIARVHTSSPATSTRIVPSIAK